MLPDREDKEMTDLTRSSSDSDSDCGEGPSTSNAVTIKKKKYGQFYKDEWEKLPEFSGWLMKSKKSRLFAKCKACDKDINISSGKDALLKHGISKFHQGRVRAISKQTTLTSFAIKSSTDKFLEDDIKKGEIRLASFLAEHNLAFNVADHLVKVITTICHDSKIAKGLTCNRTKATAIVTNVLGTERFDFICNHLRNNKFSLIVDESTDRSNVKHFCLLARFINNNVVEDNFLGLIKLSGADAATLYNKIVQLFQQNNIPYKDNLIGFASDGANVMMGQHRSLMTLLKNDIPSLYIVKCICHSFHLCASYASQKLPRFVEDLVRDIYNYFASSPKRVSELTAFLYFCNTTVHKILHPSQTRWLSLHAVVSRILEQYGALTLFFTDAVSENDILAAENILVKLKDPVTKLFLQFLDFVLPLFNNLNREMQSESPKLHLIYSNICNILKMIFDCFIKREYLHNTSIENIDFKNPRHYLELKNIYLGANATKTILETKISDEQLHFFRLRCLDFYVEGCSQITKRFPLKNNVLQNLNFLDPAVVKSGKISSITETAILFPNLVQNLELQTLDSEWRLLRNTHEIQTFSDKIETFWQQVRNSVYGDGTPMFEVLATFVFHLLCLPHSSANVERIFSTINLMKTKVRNKLETNTISSLLYTKQLIGTLNCYDFPIAKELISKMNNKNLYESKNLTESD